jgi:hypothetical protein
MNQGNNSNSLEHLYQQRKAQHKMPKSLVSNVQQAARTMNKRPFTSISTSIWGSTVAACFVALLSYQFIPQPSLDELPQSSTSADLLPIQTRQMAAPLNENMATEQVSLQSTSSQASTVMMQEKSQSNAGQDNITYRGSQATTQADASPLRKSISLPTEKTINAREKQLVRQAKKKMMKAESQRMVNSHPALEAIAASGAKALVKQIKIVQLAPLKNDSQWRIATDCDQQIITIAEHWLKDTRNSRWLKVTLDTAGDIIAVTALFNHKGCNHSE